MYVNALQLRILLCQAHPHSHHLCLQEFGSNFSPLAAKELLAPALAEYFAGEQHKRQLNLAANGFPWEEGMLQGFILQKSSCSADVVLSFEVKRSASPDAMCRQ